MTLIIAMFSAVAALAANHQTGDQFLASARFHFDQPSQVRVPVQTCSPNKGTVKMIQLRVLEGSLDLYNLTAVSNDGAKTRLAAPEHLNKGQASNWIPLGGSGLCLSRFELQVGASPSREFTNVQFMGHWE